MTLRRLCRDRDCARRRGDVEMWVVARRVSCHRDQRRRRVESDESRSHSLNTNTTGRSLGPATSAGRPSACLHTGPLWRCPTGAASRPSAQGRRGWQGRRPGAAHPYSLPPPRSTLPSLFPSYCVPSSLPSTTTPRSQHYSSSDGLRSNLVTPIGPSIDSSIGDDDASPAEVLGGSGSASSTCMAGLAPSSTSPT